MEWMEHEARGDDVEMTDCSGRRDAFGALDAHATPASRFLHETGGSVFEHARSRALMQQTRARCDPLDDVVYAKAQFVPWEDDIQWGFDCGAEKELARIEEEEEEDHDEAVERRAPLARVEHTLPPTRGVQRENKRLDCAASSHQAKPAQLGSEAVETHWESALIGSEFDMTKPRHYRWDIPGKVSDGVHSTSPLVQRKTADARGRTVLPSPLNKELDDGSWVDAIGWNSTRDMPESKLILDENDTSLILVDADEQPPIIHIQVRAPSSHKVNISRTEGHANDLHHSLPAIKLSMTKPELPKAKLREFHRPRSKFKINERMVFAPPPVVPIPPVEGAVVTQIKKSSDLNLTAGGKIILVEYTEQNPPMLSNPGMASRILHYWRPPDNEEDVLVGKKKVKKAKPKAPEMKMGQVITLGHHDETPFVGDVPPGRVVTSLNSKLYKVPIFQHKPVAPFAPSTSVRESGQYELFLLCRSASKGKKGAAIGESAKTTMYAFEMPDLYLAGQIEPQIEVPAPNSDAAKKFIQPYMSLHISRMFGKAKNARLSIDDVQRAFPSQSGTAIRKAMKTVATFERGGNDSGAWLKNATVDLAAEEARAAALTPEAVCLYESMMAGQRRLLDVGLTKLFTAKGVENAIDLLLKRLESRKQALFSELVGPRQLSRSQKARAERDIYERDPTIRKLEADIQVARYIHDELQLTPWNLTGNYVECHLQGKGLLTLGGVGDPTGRGEGFSFVRAPPARVKKPDTFLESAHSVEKMIASVAGTTADLRKLKMKEVDLVLRKLGMSESDVKKMTRWERVRRLRVISSEATARGEGGALRKFARGGRKSLSVQQQDYHRQCDVIYERQMDVLSSTTISFSDDDEADDDGDSESMEDFEDELLGAVRDVKHDRERIRKLIQQRLHAKDTPGLNRSRETRAERDEAVELARLMRDMEDGSTPVSGANRRADVDASKLRTQLRASGIADGGSGSAAASVAGTRPGSLMGMSRGGSNMASAINTPIEHRSRASSPTSASKWPSSVDMPSRVPGRKVLKRTTRVVEEDGTETVRIEFIVDDRQVARFQAKQHRQDRLQKADKRKVLRKRSGDDCAERAAKKPKHESASEFKKTV